MASNDLWSGLLANNASGSAGASGAAGATGAQQPINDALLEEFYNALASYITGSLGGGGGFGAPMANWMRNNQADIGQRFLEQFMKRQMATGDNSLTNYKPTDFLQGFNPEQMYAMTEPNYRGGIGRMPAISVRRLRV